MGCMCVHACACVICAGACTNMYMEVKEGCPLSLSSLSFKAESLSETGAYGFQLSRQPANPSSLLSPPPSVLGLQVNAASGQLVLGF